MNIYLIPIQEIKDSTFIDDNVSDKMIKVASLDAQQQILEPVLGSKLYNKLLTDVKNNAVDSTYQTLITDYIWAVLLQATIYKLSYNLLFRITNSSIVKDNNENSTAITTGELKILIKERELSMNYHIDKLRKRLKTHPDLYPEYLGQQEIDGDTPDLTDNNLSFWNYED